MCINQLMPLRDIRRIMRIVRLNRYMRLTSLILIGRLKRFRCLNRFMLLMPGFGAPYHGRQ